MKQDEVVIQLHKPDASEMIFFFLCGVITSVPLTLFIDQFAGYLIAGFNAFYATLISTAVFSPFIEEFSKAYPLFYRHGETQRSIFTLGLLTGFGFGITEFFLYIFVYNAPFLIRIPGVLFHAASASIIAYGIATKKPLIFYLVAVFLHFSYNFFTVLGNVWYIIDTFILIFTYILSFGLYMRTTEKIIEYPK